MAPLKLEMARRRLGGIINEQSEADGEANL